MKLVAADFFVSPTGTASTAAGTGTLANPWALQTALSQPAAVHAGDTIWLRGGRYAGSFTSYLTGTSGSPVTLRSYQSERATLDGNGSSNTTLQILGAWAVYWGFEVTNSDPNRPNVQGSRPTAIDVSAPNMQFINLVVHDGGQGFGFWTPAVNGGIYGSLIYYNGNSTFDHGIYAQNDTGTKKIEDNLIFNNYGYGLHIYGSDLCHLNNFYLSGNASFRNGLLGGGSPNRNMLLGGGALANNPTLLNNFFYSKKDGTQPGTGWMLGYNYGLGSQNATVQNNYVADDVMFVSPAGLTMSGNTFYTSPGYFVGVSPSSYPSNTYTNTRPASPVVFVRPNRYEAGRANIVVFNWGQQATVDVDVSGVLTAGTPYEIRSAQNFFGPPVRTGTYDGTPISLPMTGLTAATPVGFAVPASSGPEFNSFVLLKVAGGSCSYSLGGSSSSVASGAGSGSVSVTTTAGCPWTATSGVPWLTVSGGASGSGNGTVTYNVAANPTCVARTGTLQVAGLTFTVNQSAGTLSASLNPASASTGAAGSSGSVAVTAGASCPWTATSNAAWLGVVSGGSGSGSGTVSYSVAANGTCAARTGSLTIAGRTFTVSQSAGATAASISPTAASTGAASGGGSINVTAGASCPWTAASNAAWITISAGSSGAGNGIVNYTIAANTGCARTGTLTVAGQTFTVSQAVGGSCAGTGFHPVTPCRAIDTRNAASSLGGPALTAGQARTFPLTASTCGIPSSAISVAINVTAVKPDASGTLHVYPGNQAPTTAAAVSFPARRTRASAANILLATDGSGRIGVYNESAGAANVVIDVSGYYQ